MVSLPLVDKRHRFIAAQDLFRGTLDGASVHPREVVIDALKHQAAAVILVHNIPAEWRNLAKPTSSSPIASATNGELRISRV